MQSSVIFICNSHKVHSKLDSVAVVVSTLNNVDVKVPMGALEKRFNL